MLYFAARMKTITDNKDMKQSLTVTMLLLLLAMSVTCCRKYESCPGSDSGQDDNVTCVSFRFMKPEDGDGTKSSVTADDDMIKDLDIFVYSGGILEGEAYVTDFKTAKINLTSGKEYSFYALVNTGDIQAPTREEELATYRYRINGMSDFNAKGFPMTASKTVKIQNLSQTVDLQLERLIAKINLKVDASALPGFKVTSARLVNSPADITPFTTGSEATSAIAGDAASSGDLSLLNSGKTAAFYMLENCQGVLLPQNKDQWEKIPDNIPADKRGLCTYMEVSATLDGSVGLEGPVTYRFYLGQDVTSDFNIFRNTENTVTLTTTDEGLDKVSWRIDNSRLTNIPIPLIAVANDGYIFYTESNGKFIQVKTSSDDWNCVTYGGKKYVAAGKGGAIAYSSNGSKWSVIHTDKSYDWNDIIYWAGRYIAVGSGGGIGYSSDGIHWQTQKKENIEWNSIAYGSNKFVIVGKYDAYHGALGYSSSGTSWTVSSNISYQNIRNAIAYGNGIFVATGKAATYTGTAGYSKDGINWTYDTKVGALEHTEICYGNNKFLCTGYNEFMSSPDGKTWETERGVGYYACRDIIYSDGVFVIACTASSSTSGIYYSSDGYHWVNAADPTLKNIRINGICAMQ